MCAHVHAQSRFFSLSIIKDEKKSHFILIEVIEIEIVFFYYSKLFPP